MYDISKEYLEKKYYEEGLTGAEIAEEKGCTPSYIYYKMDQYGLERNYNYDVEERTIGRREIEIDEDYLKEKYCEEDLALRDIADELNCSHELVRTRLIEIGVI